jgi:N-acetylated-alpha-linked acidic dipeptidase
MNHWLRWLGVGAFLIVLVTFFAKSSAKAQETGGIRGFSPAHAEGERALEQALRVVPDAAHAENDLRYLTSQPHMAGTEASRRVAEWLREQYRSFGFDAEIVTYSAWLPQPREVKLELLAPKHRTLASPEQPFEEDKDTYDKRAVAGFNAYSPSGVVAAPVVYANYGMVEDYHTLESLGVTVEGKIVITRYGHGYRGVKAKLAEEHKAAGLIIYSDPQDDGYVAGDTFPRGPWRPMTGIQRGSILFTEIYPGDPLTPGVGSTADAKRLEPADALSVPHIPTMPIHARDAAVILAALGGQRVPRGWQGGLPFTYHMGAGETKARMKLAMDFDERPLYDVISKLHGSSDDQWVVLGNHHDAWVFGAADPNSGTAAMLEMARALGELVRTGWKPQRTIVMCHWDGEEPGLIGSTEWVEANRAELQTKAVAYINTDVGVSGPNFSAAATPSLKEVVREATREVQDPQPGRSVYDSWREHAAHRKEESAGEAPPRQKSEASAGVPIGALGAGSDFCPFFDFAGIPSIDVGFAGEYGVYHSLYDDFYWMKHFGDPTFAYHVALARILGTLTLRLDEADILPFDFESYASEIAQGESDLASRASELDVSADSLKPVADASAAFSRSALRAAQALRSPLSAPLDLVKENEINHVLATVEQALLAPEGLVGRPWYKHTIFAPGSYAGYSAEMLPGVSESLDRKDLATLRREVDALAQALRRAATRLDEAGRLASPPK